MKKTKKERKINITTQEIVLYCIAGVFIIWGVVEIILGLITQFADVKVSDFGLYTAEQTYISIFGMSFLYWGIVLTAIGVIFGVIVLCVYASKYDREAEKASRRAARLAMMKENLTNVNVIEEEKVQEEETTNGEAK